MTAKNLEVGNTYLVFYQGEWRTAEYSGWASGQRAYHFSCHDGNNAYITRNELPHQVRADYETAKR